MQKYTEVFYDNELDCGYAFTDNGIRFLFDMDDADLVRSRGWHLSKRGYIAGKDHRKEKPLHKFIIKADSSFDVDHINREKTDCRKINLRVCTHQENCFNQGKRITNTSGYMGVSFSKRSGKYESYINHNGIKHHLGLFETAEEAARVRDRHAIEYFGSICYLNFPQIGGLA